MELSEEKKREYVRRLIIARTRMLSRHGFYGLLLMHARFALDDRIETAATDGDRIIFSPKFMDELNDRELDFVLMHEIMHIALRHCDRKGERDNYAFNVACDIVVNSNILLSNGMNKNSITLSGIGALMNTAPNGKDGYLYTAEEVYEMFEKKGGRSGGCKSGKAAGAKKDGKGGESFDDHSLWKNDDGDGDMARTVWDKRIIDAARAVKAREDAGMAAGDIPAFAERKLKELREGQTDWRTILDEFVQEEVTDYSFTPPDRRYDGDFFLPDFNDKEYNVSNILFMIDTSGSMTDDMITAAYSEIKGAIEQFGGRLDGLVGFFEAAVTGVEPFCDVNSLLQKKPKGGGGTNFRAVFKYVRENMEEPPASIVMLTDGYDDFPKESEAGGIPVLWLLNNDKITPPWGKIARIKIE